MATILGGGVFGQLSGKVGSLVFSRNRRGNYVKSLVRPIDPCTLAQLNSRINFGTSANSYHSLDGATKSLWQNFATNTFLPKHGILGVSSGINAYTSLLNTVKNTTENPGVSWLDDATPMPMTAGNFDFSSVPPVHQLQSTIKSSTDSIYMLNFASIAISNVVIGPYAFSADYVLEFNVAPISPVPGGNFTGTVDGVGNEFGFNLYMSNGMAQDHMYVSNAEITLVSSIPSIESVTTASSMPQTLTCSFSKDVLALDRKSLPQIGQTVQFSLYAVSKTGMLLRIGTQKALLS